jgi:hypothetical protein
MKTSLESYQNDFFSKLDNYTKFLFFVRDKELQIAAINELKELKEKISVDKQRCISIKNEPMANCILSDECLIQIYINLLTMIVNLKNNEPSKAWDHMVMAENNMRWAKSAARNMFNINDGEIYNMIQFYEKYIFPHQMYNSIEAIYSTSKCSICNSEYGECNHIKGRAYMGEFCYEVISDIQSMPAIAIVEEPASKLHRITHVSEGTRMIDVMTLKESEEKTEKIEKLIK